MTARLYLIGPQCEPFLINILSLRLTIPLPLSHTLARTCTRTRTHVLPIWILVILAAKDLLTFYHEIFRALFYLCATAADVVAVIITVVVARPVSPSC